MDLVHRKVGVMLKDNKRMKCKGKTALLAFTGTVFAELI